MHLSPTSKLGYLPFKPIINVINSHVIDWTLQDSIVALQALLEYAKKDPNRHLYNMALYITATSTPGWQKVVTLNSSNFMELQKVEVGLQDGLPWQNAL